MQCPEPGHRSSISSNAMPGMRALREAAGLVGASLNLDVAAEETREPRTAANRLKICVPPRNPHAVHEEGARSAKLGSLKSGSARAGHSLDTD